MNQIQAISWRVDLPWSLMLIVLTVVIHVYGLVLINQMVVNLVTKRAQGRRFTAGHLALVMGPTALLVTCLHAMEGGAWAATYFILGALPDVTSAVLYS